MKSQIEGLKEELSGEELEYFEQLAPSYQKNFINHAFSGKQEKTRLKNLEEVKGALELKCKNIFEYKKKINPRETIPKDLSDDKKIELFFGKIEDSDHKVTVKNIYFNLITGNPGLKELYAWNQPMISFNDTFICAFSVAKNHFSIGFDEQALEVFREEFQNREYGILKKGIQIKWSQEVDYELLDKAVKFTMEYKKVAKGFWK